MTEFTNTLSTCNYNSLGNYSGLNRLPNTLGNISNPFVTYPVNIKSQVIPYFAGTGNYSKPNYNVLTKGSPYNHPGITKAYIDCSNPDSKEACALNDGQCVKYITRPC